jgi:hypothetical protein
MGSAHTGTNLAVEQLQALALGKSCDAQEHKNQQRQQGTRKANVAAAAAEAATSTTATTAEK